ncbi:MAG: tetratricopeptide repeat protein, partial [Thermodesulfobacteriota bacterium]
LFNIAMAYSEGGKPGDAARILDRVLDSEPDFCERNPKACVNAAMAYRKAGRPADARRLIETALEKEPELREAREMLQSLAQ